MADNIVIANKNVAFDEVTIDGQSVVVARDKVGFGSSGSYADVEATNPLPVADVNVGTAADASSASTVIGLLKALKAALTTTAANFLSVRLTDGGSYLGSTAQRLWISDGGVALSTADSAAGTKLDTLHADLGHLTDGTAQVKYAAPASSTPANVAASASSVTLAAANAGRRGLYVYNDGTANLFLKLGATASTSSFTVKVPAGGLYELPAPYYRGVVDGIWDAANGNARVTEIA